MSESLEAERAFTTKAREILADPRLGPESADTARGLLHSNNYLYGETITALQTGKVDKLADPEMFQFIKRFDDEALEHANSWRDVFERPVVAS
jgi:hypothetical protein